MLLIMTLGITWCLVVLSLLALVWPPAHRVAQAAKATAPVRDLRTPFRTPLPPTTTPVE